MSLRDVAATIPTPRQGFDCGVIRLGSKLDAEDLELFTEWVGDETVKASWIVRVLRADGHIIGEQVLRRHRRGECRCGTD